MWESMLTLNYLRGLNINENDISNIERWYAGNTALYVEAVRKLEEYISMSISDIAASKKDEGADQLIGQLRRDNQKLQNFIEENEKLFTVYKYTDSFNGTGTEGNGAGTEGASSSNIQFGSVDIKESEGSGRGRSSYSSSTISFDDIARKIYSGMYLDEVKFILLKDGNINAYRSPEELNDIDALYFMRLVGARNWREIGNLLNFIKKYREAGLLHDGHTIEQVMKMFSVDTGLELRFPYSIFEKVYGISAFKIALRIAHAPGVNNGLTATDPVDAIAFRTDIPRVSADMKRRGIQLLAFLYGDEEIEPSKAVDVFINILAFLKHEAINASSSTSFFPAIEKSILRDLDYSIHRNRDEDKIRAAKYILKTIVENNSLNRKADRDIKEILARAKIALAYRAVAVDADAEDIGETLSEDKALTSFLLSFREPNSYVEVIKRYAKTHTPLLKQLQLAHTLLISNSKELSGYNLLETIHYIANRTTLSSPAGVARAISEYRSYINSDRRSEIQKMQKAFFGAYLANLTYNPSRISDEALSQFMDIVSREKKDPYPRYDLSDLFIFYSTFKDATRFKSIDHIQLYDELFNSETMGFYCYREVDKAKRYVKFLSSIDKCYVESDTRTSFVDNLYKVLDKNLDFKKIHGLQGTAVHDVTISHHIQNVFLILDTITDGNSNLYQLNMDRYLQKINILLGYIGKYRTDRFTTSLTGWIGSNYKTNSGQAVNVKNVLIDVLGLDNGEIAGYLNSRFNCISIPANIATRARAERSLFRRYMPSCFGGSSNSQRSRERTGSRSRGSSSSLASYFNKCVKFR